MPDLTIRQISRERLFSVFKDWELVKLFEDIIQATGTTLPDNSATAEAAADEALGQASLVMQPAGALIAPAPEVFQPDADTWPNGIGYPDGAGGSVVQLASKTTGVTLNALCGRIVTDNSAIPSAGVVSFTLTNDRIGAHDRVLCQRMSGGTDEAYQVWVDSSAAGSCSICIRNISAGGLGEVLTLEFSVFKSAIN